MKLLTLMMLLTGMSAIAQTNTPKPSAFERGFQEGKASCEANSIKEAWVCKIIQYKVIPNCDGYASYGDGKSRAEALMKINPYCSADAAVLGIKPVCTKL